MLTMSSFASTTHFVEEKGKVGDEDDRIKLKTGLGIANLRFLFLTRKAKAKFGTGPLFSLVFFFKPSLKTL